MKANAKREWRGRSQKVNLMNASISGTGQECQSRIPVKNTEKDPMESIRKKRGKSRVMVSEREGKKS